MRTPGSGAMIHLPWSATASTEARPVDQNHSGCCWSTPSLALFLVSGALIGAGAGAVFKGTTGLVLGRAAPENRLALTSELLIALFVGLSIPVVGAGIALDRGATPPDTVLGFAIVVALAVAASGWVLLGRRAWSAAIPTQPKGDPP
jgi:hypothetical protein